MRVRVHNCCGWFNVRVAEMDGKAYFQDINYGYTFQPRHIIFDGRRQKHAGTKLRVGDIVRIVKSDFPDQLGKIGVIAAMCSADLIAVEIDAVPCKFSSDCLELFIGKKQNNLSFLSCPIN